MTPPGTSIPQPWSAAGLVKSMSMILWGFSSPGPVLAPAVPLSARIRPTAASNVAYLKVCVSFLPAPRHTGRFLCCLNAWAESTCLVQAREGQRSSRLPSLAVFPQPRCLRRCPSPPPFPSPRCRQRAGPASMSAQKTTAQGEHKADHLRTKAAQRLLPRCLADSPSLACSFYVAVGLRFGASHSPMPCDAARCLLSPFQLANPAVGVRQMSSLKPRVPVAATGRYNTASADPSRSGSAFPRDVRTEPMRLLHSQRSEHYIMARRCRQRKNARQKVRNSYFRTVRGIPLHSAGGFSGGEVGSSAPPVAAAHAGRPRPKARKGGDGRPSAGGTAMRPGVSPCGGIRQITTTSVGMPFSTGAAPAGSQRGGLRRPSGAWSGTRALL